MIITVTKFTGGIVCLLSLLVSTNISPADGKGILFPQESETRERKSLDGIWSFRIAPRNDPELGFREEWFSRPLAEVSRYNMGNGFLLNLITGCHFHGKWDGNIGASKKKWFCEMILFFFLYRPGR